MALAVQSQMPSGVGAFASAQASPWSWSFTNTSGTVLYVFVQIDNGTAAPLAVAMTYGGISMTGLGFTRANSGNNGYLGLFRLLSPATGANNFSVSWTTSGASSVTGGAISFTGNDGTTPDSGTAATANDGGVFSGPASVAVTGTTSGNIVIAGFASGDPGFASPSGTQSFIKELDGSAYTDNIEGQRTTSASGTVTTTVAGVSSWAAVAIEVKASAGGSSFIARRNPSQLQAVKRASYY